MKTNLMDAVVIAVPCVYIAVIVLFACLDWHWVMAGWTVGVPLIIFIKGTMDVRMEKKQYNEEHDLP